MKSENLLKIANQIGQFFRSEPDHETAVNGIANHINKFWSPQMRHGLRAHIRQYDDADLDQLVREAVARIRTRTEDPSSGIKTDGLE